MTSVELIVQQNCTLCEHAKKTLKRLRNEVPFEFKQTLLTEDHPKYKQYLVAVPVVLVRGTKGSKELAGNISELTLRQALGMVYRLTPSLSAAKFLEVLGFLVVFAGLVNGVRGDMWTDLYFFLAGIMIFVFGRMVEKREMKRQHLKTMDGKAL